MESVSGRRREVDENLPDIFQARLGAIYNSTALRNRAFSSVLAVTPPTAGTATVIAAAKLITKASGIFLAGVAVPNSDATAGDTVTYNLQTVTDAVQGTPLTLGSARQGGPGTPGLALSASGVPTNVTDNGAYSANAGGGITITGGATPILLAAQTQKVIGTAAAGDQFTWIGLIEATGNPTTEQPFTRGMTCLFQVLVANSVAGRSVGNVGIFLVELP